MDRPLRFLTSWISMSLGFATLLSVAPSSVAFATASFNIVAQSETPTTEVIGLYATDPQWAQDECAPSAYTPCWRQTVFVRVTPCPPDKPCTNGGYEFTIDHLWPPITVLDLTRGVTYTFEGTVRIDVGPSASPCDYTCTYDHPIETVTHETLAPDQFPHWDVSVVSANLDTVWVDAKLIDTTENSDCASRSDCVERVVSLRVSPCPLLFAGDFCDPGMTGYTGRFALGSSVRIALHTGDSYLLQGGWTLWGYWRDHSGFCGEHACSYSQVAGDLGFKASAVATRPTTWGRVKALYRE